MPFDGRKLAAAREEAGLSQPELAEAVGLKSAYISHLETGKKKNPSFALVEAMAKVLGVSCADLGSDPGQRRK